ncbi:MAG: hypothetical protein MUF70_11980 [Myxococcota bacterium]|jgi:hypothetical protein|nr:hypothetical protein [Myxococcota bacterium]
MAPVAFAEDATVNVHFDAGQHSKEFESSIQGDAGVNYMLQVKEGQVMQVLFSTSKGSCYMNVFEPGNTSEAVHIGSTSGNEFGASPTKAGTYKIQVYQMRATARRNETCKYAISFEVTGAGKASAPAAAAGPSEVAKGACLYKIGVDAEIAQASALKPGYWELIMKAKSGHKKVACTVSDDGEIADWVEMK